MSKLAECRATLRQLRSVEEWKAYLLKHSGLPGPRANLELLEAAFHEGSEPLFAACRAHPPERASADSAEVYLAVVGVVGLARNYLDGEKAAMRSLRAFASDPRWRVREAVAIGLQYIGDRGMEPLLAELASWQTGNLLEQRAVVAALCEPRLLKARAIAEQVVGILTAITRAIEAQPDRKADEFRVLRQSLGYGWSVAVVAAPVKGKAAFARWLKSTDKDMRWIVKENLAKNRLVRMDAAWVESVKGRLAGLA